MQLDEIEIIVDAEDAKKIWEQLINYLPVYALFHSDRKNQDLDSEVQDPLKFAIEQIFKRDDIQKKLSEIAQNIENEISQKVPYQSLRTLLNKMLKLNLIFQKYLPLNGKMFIKILGLILIMKYH